MIIGDFPTERVHLGADDVGIGEGEVVVAEFVEGVGGEGVGAEEAAVSGVGVVEEEGGLAIRQPVAEEIVRGGGILFEVVKNQVGVLGDQVVAADLIGPEDVLEGFQPEGEVEQVVGETVRTEAVGAFLSVGVDASLTAGRLPTAVADPRGREACADFRVGEANEGGFVQVVEYLAVQAVAVEGDAFKKTFVFDEGADDPRHVVLGGFEVEEGGGIVGGREPGRFSGEGPEEFDHALGQPADGADMDEAACKRGVLEGVVVGLGKGFLGDEHEDFIPRYAPREEPAHPFDSEGGFARAGGAFEEGFGGEGEG